MTTAHDPRVIRAMAREWCHINAREPDDLICRIHSVSSAKNLTIQDAEIDRIVPLEKSGATDRAEVGYDERIADNDPSGIDSKSAATKISKLLGLILLESIEIKERVAELACGSSAGQFPLIIQCGGL